MWWRIVRLGSYILCSTLIVASVASWWHIFAINVQLGKQHRAGVIFFYGFMEISVMRFNDPIPSRARWIKFSRQETDSSGSIFTPFPPLNRPRMGHRAMPGYTQSYLDSASVWPLLLSIVGIGLTAWTGHRARRARRRRPGHCLCAHDLRGTPDATACPECGAAIERADAAQTDA